MTIKKLSISRDGEEHTLEPTAGLYVKKETDPEMRSLWCRCIKSMLCGGKEMNSGMLEVENGGRTVSLTFQGDLPQEETAYCAAEQFAGMSAHDFVIGMADLEVETTFERHATADERSRYDALISEMRGIESCLTELSRSYGKKYRALKATVFEGITADQASRRMKQAEYQIKEIKKLSNTRRMNRSWQIPLICAVLVTVMAVTKNPRLYIVTGMLILIAALSFFIMKKTEISKRDGEEQIKAQLSEFGARDEPEMKENVRIYCRKYSEYLRDWHEAYALEANLSKLRNRLGILLNSVLARVCGEDTQKFGADSAEGRFWALVNNIPQDVRCPLVIDDAFHHMDDDGCLAALHILSQVANSGRQVILFTSSERELNYAEKGWVVPPPGQVENTPFRLFG